MKILLDSSVASHFLFQTCRIGQEEDWKTANRLLKERALQLFLSSPVVMEIMG